MSENSFLQRNDHNKAIVWKYWQTINEATRSYLRPGEFNKTVLQALHRDTSWHGFRPLRNLRGSSEIWERFWQPLLNAIPDLIRRPYLFIGGHFEDGDWVCGTGDFIGTFSKDWLGIPASGHSVHFRFGEFCKIENGLIVEIRIIIDLPDLMRQAGINLMPPNFGRDIWIPGPLEGDGILQTQQIPQESNITLKLVEGMIYDGLNQYDQVNQNSMGLERFWHPQMVWHGSVGIGSAYGIMEFKKNAQGPIIQAFPDRKGVPHRARIAEGHFAASTGWPSLVGTHQEDYMGWTAIGKKVGWNIMDFWKREGNLLLENWNLIDLIDAAMQSGVDLFPFSTR